MTNSFPGATTAPLSNKDQLIEGLIGSLKLLFVALSFIVLFFFLLIKSLVGFTMVVLMAVNMGCEWAIAWVGSVEEVKVFASFLVVKGGH